MLVQGCTKIPGGECHMHGIWVKEKMERFGCFYSHQGFWHWWWWMYRWTTVFPVHMHSGFPAGRSKQMIVASWNDATMISLLFWEGTIKGEHTQTLGLSSGFSDTEQLGLLTSQRPSTLAILVPLMEQSITRMNCVFHLSICMYPDLFGELLVSMTLVVWHQLGRSLPASPWTQYWAKHRSQTFGSGLQGQDKSLVWCESHPSHLVYLCNTCHI